MSGKPGPIGADKFLSYDQGVDELDQEAQDLSSPSSVKTIQGHDVAQVQVPLDQDYLSALLLSPYGISSDFGNWNDNNSPDARNTDSFSIDSPFSNVVNVGMGGNEQPILPLETEDVKTIGSGINRRRNQVEDLAGNVRTARDLCGALVKEYGVDSGELLDAIQGYGEDDKQAVVDRLREKMQSIFEKQRTAFKQAYQLDPELERDTEPSSEAMKHNLFLIHMNLSKADTWEKYMSFAGGGRKKVDPVLVNKLNCIMSSELRMLNHRLERYFALYLRPPLEDTFGEKRATRRDWFMERSQSKNSNIVQSMPGPTSTMQGHPVEQQQSANPQSAIDWKAPHDVVPGTPFESVISFSDEALEELQRPQQPSPQQQSPHIVQSMPGSILPRKRPPSNAMKDPTTHKAPLFVSSLEQRRPHIVQSMPGSILPRKPPPSNSMKDHTTDNTPWFVPPIDPSLWMNRLSSLSRGASMERRHDAEERKRKAEDGVAPQPPSERPVNVAVNAVPPSQPRVTASTEGPRMSGHSNDRVSERGTLRTSYVPRRTPATDFVKWGDEKISLCRQVSAAVGGRNLPSLWRAVKDVMDPMDVGRIVLQYADWTLHPDDDPAAWKTRLGPNDPFVVAVVKFIKNWS